jgi:hypothetical protein
MPKSKSLAKWFIGITVAAVVALGGAEAWRAHSHPKWEPEFKEYVELSFGLYMLSRGADKAEQVSACFVDEAERAVTQQEMEVSLEGHGAKDVNAKLNAALVKCACEFEPEKVSAGLCK